MNKIKLILLVFGLLLIQISSLKSQITVVGTEKVIDKLRLNQGIEGKENILYHDIQGDPYIFKDFQKGTLIAISDEKFNVNVRYDVYANEMHLKDSNEIFAIIRPEKVKLIEAGNLKFIYSLYVKSSGEENTRGSSYFVLNTDGKCKLLIKKNVRVQDAEPPKLYTEAKPAKFILTSDTYYLKLDDNIAVKIGNKKELLAVLEDKKEAISNFIGSKKLNVKDIEDLVSIISYYNGL